MWKTIHILIWLIIFNHKIEASDPDTFTEELFFKPLSNNQLYAYFQFTTTRPTDLSLHHTNLFPRSLGEIIARYDIEELHLSLTEGLWRHANWGYPIVNAPPGAELYVWFSNNTQNIDVQWKLLTETLSGLFCASLNFIDQLNSLNPKLSFKPTGVGSNSGNESLLRYATLPREIVCTENLTPWKKLLPCDSKRGLATLLNSDRLHNTNYHSLGIHFRSICSDNKCTKRLYELKQTMSLLYDSEITGSRDWSINRLFGQGIFGPCPLASKSYVSVDLSSNETSPFTLTPEYSFVKKIARAGSTTELAVYDLNAQKSNVFNIACMYANPDKVNIRFPPQIHANRYIAGYGQERSGITTQIRNNHWQPIDIIFLENIPWFLPVYLQSLTIVSNGKKLTPTAKHYVPGKGKIRPYYLELALTLPPKSTTKISIDFDYVFLKWQEYPPDANHGFYVGSAVITAVTPVTKNFTASVLSLDETRSSTTGPVYFIKLYTESMIITLPTPDFSMPYNVICLACTVVALAFGPLHNITTKSLRLDTNDENKNTFQLIKEKLFRKKRKEPDSDDSDKKKD